MRSSATTTASTTPGTASSRAVSASTDSRSTQPTDTCSTLRRRGSRSPIAISIHPKHSPAHTASTTCSPPAPSSQPPMIPPANAPRYCNVEYTPSAAPRARIGATLDTIAGRLASRVLNPMK